MGEDDTLGNTCRPTTELDSKVATALIPGVNDGKKLIFGGCDEFSISLSCGYEAIIIHYLHGCVSFRLENK